MEFLENVARDLCACERLEKFWDGDVVISRLWIPYSETKGETICNLFRSLALNK